MVVTDSFDIYEIYRALVEQSPGPIALYVGSNMKIAVANDAMLMAYGKDRSVIGKPFSKAVPELNNQPFFGILQEVYKNGIPYFMEASQADVIVDGRLQTFYFNFDYKPLKDKDGKVWGIINTATNITQYVLHKKSVEQTEEMLRLAVDSASMGTWFLDALSRELTSSGRTRELFGFYGKDSLTLEAAMGQIPGSHRQQVIAAIDEAITKDMKYDIEYPVTGYHDQQLRWLRVTGKLYEAEEGKSPFLAGTVLDVTARKQDELRKNDFISMVSHELKTPLTSLIAYLQMLLENAKKGDDSFTIHALEKSNLQLERMRTLIKGFLNISRLDNSGIHLIKKDFDLYNLVLEAVEETRLLVTDHKIIFESCNPIKVHGDPDKLRSVISNLLSNAVKYSQKGKTIEVKCETAATSIQISIKDEGIGIHPRDAKRLFERYYRIESDKTQNISGLGIGLYLSAEIIQRHDGKIWVESTSGKGSTFYFSLPLLKH